jgi:hypothetical protein
MFTRDPERQKKTAVAKLDNINLGSLESIGSGSSELLYVDPHFSAGTELTPQPTLHSPRNSQVTEGRVAQLAEQLTLNQ